MKEIKNVVGCIEQAQPLVITPNIVYVHTNIKKLEPSEHMKVHQSENLPELYSYDEIQYTTEEYIKMMSDENASLNQQVVDTQLALVEVYEVLTGGI
jgi:hypothetical protein